MVLVCSERKVLLADCWWLIYSERKVLLAGGLFPSSRLLMVNRKVQRGRAEGMMPPPPLHHQDMAGPEATTTLEELLPPDLPDCSLVSCLSLRLIIITTGLL
jgi:hypothetical protein